MTRDLPATVLNGGKTVKTGRDALGRFTAGGPPGPGRPVANPFARYQTELRQALLSQVKPADVQSILRKVVQLAKRGNLAATELLLKWSLGGPPPAIDADKVEAHELEVRRSRPTLVDAMTLADEQADRQPAAEADADEEDADDETAMARPAAPLPPAPLHLSLQEMLRWAVRELAEAQRPPPPPDSAQGWQCFSEQRLEFDETAAAEVDGLYLAYLRWSAGHGEVALEEAKVLAALQARGATLHTGALTRTTMVVGVRLTA